MAALIMRGNGVNSLADPYCAVSLIFHFLSLSWQRWNKTNMRRLFPYSVSFLLLKLKSHYVLSGLAVHDRNTKCYQSANFNTKHLATCKYQEAEWNGRHLNRIACSSNMCNIEFQPFETNYPIFCLNLPMS